MNVSQTSAKTPYTPMQVGKVERRNQDSAKHVRTIATHRKMADK